MLGRIKEVKRVDYQVNLGFYEGPLDLLFHLVKKHKLEVNQISLSEVTEQYLTYIKEMQERDLDFAGEFLVMAAQLMELKSKTLLPSIDEQSVEADTPHELVTRLLEYKKFKELASLLRGREEVGERYFFRDNQRVIEQIITDLPDFNPLENVTLEKFRLAFTQALEDATLREASQETEKPDRVREFKVQEFSITDKMDEVTAIIDQSNVGIGFSKLFSPNDSRLEVVVTFLALLELMKLKKIIATQSGAFDEIMISSRGEI